MRNNSQANQLVPGSMAKTLQTAFAVPLPFSSTSLHAAVIKRPLRHKALSCSTSPSMSAFRLPNSDNNRADSTGQIYIASGHALTPMRPPMQGERMDGYSSEQELPSQRTADLMAPKSGGFWGLVPYLAGYAVVGFFGWIGYKRMKARQARLVEEYGEVMAFYGTSPDALLQITKEFKRKLGPGILRGALYSSFLRSMITEKAMGPQAIQDAAVVKRLLRLGDKKAINVINDLGEDLKTAPSLLGKLLFLSERLFSPTHIASLNLVAHFPYGPGTVLELQRNMAERCYREIVEKEIEENGAGGAPLDVAAVLRITDTEAKSIFDGVISAREKAKIKAREEEAAEIEAAEAEDASKPVVEGLDYPARSGEPAKVAVHAYQCGECGYTMFPAAGREFKFYGADFCCPTCGAPKDKFVDINE